MKKNVNKNQKSSDVAFVEQLRSTEAELGVRETLDDRNRQKDQLRVRMGLPLIERIAMLSDQQGGSVFGVPFDSKAARAAIAYAREVDVIVAAARDFATRVFAERTARLVDIASAAIAIYEALGGMQKTPLGRRLGQQYQVMKAAVRKTRGRASKAKASNAKTEAPKTATQ